MKITLVALGMIAALSAVTPTQAKAASNARPCLTVELPAQSYLKKAVDYVYNHDIDRAVITFISPVVRKIEVLEYNVIKISGDFYSVTYEMQQNCSAGIDIVKKSVERVKPNYGGGLG